MHDALGDGGSAGEARGRACRGLLAQTVGDGEALGGELAAVARSSAGMRSDAAR